MAVSNDVIALRLYYKFPGSERLRKCAAAELRHLLRVGWREAHRTAGADHMVLRLERPVTTTVHTPREREAQRHRSRT